MNQLTFGDILQFAKTLKKEGMTDKEIKALPVYLGNDNEFNGAHCAEYTDLIDSTDDSCANIVKLINEDRNNIKLDGAALLIS